MRLQSFISESVAETERFAAQFAEGLQPGDCVAIDGDLGAGKTQFVRGIVIGVDGDPRQVSSPTYVLLHIYSHVAVGDLATHAMRLPVYHIDAYRASADEIEAIGFTELLEQRGVVVVEWSSRIAELLPVRTIRVRIEPIGPSIRRIEVQSYD